MACLEHLHRTTVHTLDLFVYPSSIRFSILSTWTPIFQHAAVLLAPLKKSIDHIGVLGFIAARSIDHAAAPVALRFYVEVNMSHQYDAYVRTIALTEFYVIRSCHSIIEFYLHQI